MSDLPPLPPPDNGAAPPQRPPDHPVEVDADAGGTPLLRAVLVLVAVALVGVIASGVWMVLRDKEPGTPPVPAATSTATITSTAGATAEDGSGTAIPPSPSAGGSPVAGSTATIATTIAPAGTPVPRSGSLPSLLALAPDRLDDDSVPLPIVASYADLAAWSRVNGMAMPTGLDDPMLAAWTANLNALALPTSLGTRGTEAIWQESYGFTLTDVEQVLSVGAAPNSVTIMTGTFDRRTLEDAWVRSGYQAVKIEGVTIWSLFPGDTIDLSARASRPSLGSLNNIVLLDDGTLVAAAKLSRLQAVLKVLHGDQSSLAQNDAVRDLIAPLGDGEGVISVEIARGDLVEAPPAATAPATPGADGTRIPVASPVATPQAPTVPEVRLVLVGLRATGAGDVASVATPVAATPAPFGTATPGRDPAVEMVVILAFADDADTTAIEARAAMTQRLAIGRSAVTGEPYARRYRDPLVQVAITPGRNAVVVMRAGLADGAADWLQVVETRDLGFAFWEQEP
ncbi:MAG TPA: hypothetical protein VNP95_04560 [Thermomicrobiales bacterium]|nr:hypothetical protein [Thermomicrobiales bacterium]